MIRLWRMQTSRDGLLLPLPSAAALDRRPASLPDGLFQCCPFCPFSGSIGLHVLLDIYVITRRLVALLLGLFSCVSRAVIPASCSFFRRSHAHAHAGRCPPIGSAFGRLAHWSCPPSGGLWRGGASALSPRAELAGVGRGACQRSRCPLVARRVTGALPAGRRRVSVRPAGRLGGSVHRF